VPITPLPHGRTRLYGVLFVAGWALLGWRLVDIQIFDRHAFQERARQQHLREVVLLPRRGDLLDRQGRVLAADRLLHTVGVHPRHVVEPAVVADMLVSLAGQDRAHWLAEIAAHDRFFYILRRGELDAEPPPRHLLPAGLEVAEEYRRTYPRRSLAAGLIGYVGLDGEGLEGLELRYEPLLHGEAGHQVQQVDATGAIIPGLYELREDPVDGLDLYLTIDAVIQEVLEDELAAGVAEAEAAGGTAVALDPRTGAVLAMAVYPAFDPNVPEQVEADLRRNRVLTDTFEPGSVMKIVTFSAALDAGRFTLADTIDGGTGVIQVVGSEIKDSRPHGLMSLGEVLQFSSNVGTVKIARALGEKRLYQYARDFGFGQRTGIELPGEAAGVLRRLPDWRGSALESLSIGYGLSTTTLQIAVAYGAVANGGRLMRPYVVEAAAERGGRKRQLGEPDVIRRVMHEETSVTLRWMLRQAVEGGTGDRADVAGLGVAGKTGTARKAASGGYQVGAYISSFCGFLPAEDPSFLLLVVVDEPAGQYYAREVAAPIFARTVRRLMSHPERPLGVFSPSIEMIASETEPLVPDLRRLPPSEAGRELTRRGFRVRYIGQGPSVVSQEPAPLTPAEAGVVVILHLDAPETSHPTEAVMPDLQGLTLREAAARAWELGMKVSVEGSGRVVSQFPLAGHTVPVGTEVVLRAGQPGGGTP